MSDTGAEDVPETDLTLTLDDRAAAGLPNDSSLQSGTFKPTNSDSRNNDQFLFPAPASREISGNSLLSVFNGGNPNGTWQLFATDDGSPFGGSIAGGWSLQITAEADVQVRERVKIKRDTKKSRR